MKFYLIVSKGKHRGLPIPISVDLFVIGSGKACQLRAKHSDLADQHTAFVIRGRKVFIRDLGSGKPTIVNGVEIPLSEEWPLHRNDTVVVGPLEFRISFHEKQLNQRDLEEWALKTLDEDQGPKKSALEELDEIEGRAHTHHSEASDAAAAIIAQMSALKGVVRGRLRIQREGSVTIVRINDTYLVEEAELAHIKMELHENLSTANLRVLLDMKNVRKMSSRAISMFSELALWLKGRGSTLALCRLRPELMHIVEDLQNVFPLKVFNDKSLALKARW
jgi:anti-anti-sigma regulatory factor